MIVTYIILSLLFIILLVLLIPVRIKLKYAVNTDFNKQKKEEELKTLNYVEIYILYCIKIKKVKIGNTQNAGRRKKVLGIIYKFLLDFLNFQKIDEVILRKDEIKKLGNSIFIEKLDLNLGINLKNILVNVYLISTLNALINMYFAKKVDKMNLDKVSYQTYISNKILNIDVDSIIRFNLVNTIIIILKIIMRVRKVVKEDGKTTSNRKLNDDSYDFA